MHFQVPYMDIDMADHTNSKNVVIAEYVVLGLDRTLYSEVAQWPNAKFEALDEMSGLLTLTSNEVRTSGDVTSVISVLSETANEFALALSLQLIKPIRVRLRKTQLPLFASEDATLLHSEVALQDQAEDYISPRAPPVEMPRVKIGMQRLIGTLAEAADFSNFVEEQLRRHYLIIEELWDDFSSSFSDLEKTDRDEIKLIRDFVSHPVCDRRGVVDFVSSRLPSAKLPGSAAAVVFDRSLEHRNFVAGFEVKSRELARKLVLLKIERDY